MVSSRFILMSVAHLFVSASFVRECRSSSFYTRVRHEFDEIPHTAVWGCSMSSTPEGQYKLTQTLNYPALPSGDLL
jgi:hypothetical protein